MKLWHCNGARSLRPLWALEEMGLDYELEILPFPPRIFQREYLEENALGTVPFFRDGDVTMTEYGGSGFTKSETQVIMKVEGTLADAS